MIFAKKKCGANVPIEPTETLIRGEWELVGGRTIPNEAVSRIRDLISTELEKIGSTSSGWETLYRDRRDGRLWELIYLQSDAHGGGPESLRLIDAIQAVHKYGVGMTTNERLWFAGLMPEFDAAAQSRNSERMIEILCKIGLGSQANEIAGAVLADPKRYGY